MNIEIQKMKQEHLEQIQDILLTDFDEFWNAGVLKNELENPLSIYIVALNQGASKGAGAVCQSVGG